MINPEVFEAVQRERQWQLTKHKGWHDNPSMFVSDWLKTLRGEMLEVENADFIRDKLEEVLQVVTVGCAILSHFGVVERNYESELTMLQDERKLDERTDNTP